MALELAFRTRLPGKESQPNYPSKAHPPGYNTTTASMGQGYTQDQHIDSESIKTHPETHLPQVACKAKSRTCHTNTKC